MPSLFKAYSCILDDSVLPNLWNMTKLLAQSQVREEMVYFNCLHTESWLTSVRWAGTLTHHPPSVEDLTFALVAVCKEVPAAMFRDLVESLSRGVDAALATDYSNQDHFIRII